MGSQFNTEGLMKRARMKWDDETIADAIRGIAGKTGYFPSCGALRDMGRNDLACAISKSGGFTQWALRLGVPRKQSDSDFGWDGEMRVQGMFLSRLFACVRSSGVRAPYDLLVNGILRVDVKTANYAEYPPCRGWFYRVGKIPSSDIVFLYQMDTGDFYALPWWECPTTNVTIARNGGKYVNRKNNWPLLSEMVAARTVERDRESAAA
jgi:hypothetical protein